jgi:transcription elongation GreA/GreB family factor
VKEFKIIVQSKLMEALALRIDELKSSIDDLKEAGESETKSSAGDKYETGREMIKQEREKYDQVLQDYEKQMEIVKNFKSDKNFDRAAPGSLIVTDKMTFYISVPYGKFKVEDVDVFAISPSAPVAQLLLEKSAGDTYLLNGQEVKIKSVC